MRAKAEANRRRTSLRALIERSLRRELESPSSEDLEALLSSLREELPGLRRGVDAGPRRRARGADPGAGVSAPPTETGIAPHLAQLMADYAATGLPPAYLRSHHRRGQARPRHPRPRQPQRSWNSSPTMGNMPRGKLTSTGPLESAGDALPQAPTYRATSYNLQTYRLRDRRWHGDTRRLLKCRESNKFQA